MKGGGVVDEREETSSHRRRCAQANSIGWLTTCATCRGTTFSVQPRFSLHPIRKKAQNKTKLREMLVLQQRII